MPTSREELKKGDRVIVREPSHFKDSEEYGKVGEMGIYIGGQFPIRWDKGNIGGPSLSRLDKVKNDVKPVIHHCFLVAGSKKSFSKLGDFKVSPDEIENYLFNNYGAGFYLVKQKNENRGRIFTIKRPDPKPYEVTEGFLEV